MIKYYGWHYNEFITSFSNLNTFIKFYHEEYSCISLQDHLNEYFFTKPLTQRIIRKFFSYTIDNDQFIFDRFYSLEELEKFKSLI